MNKVKFNTTHIVIYGFFIVIMIGALILTLPVCSADGSSTNFITALFTATTSTCVTGLVVIPTYASWSIFGKIIILILIQLGGLGVISFTIGFFIITGKHISLRERRLVQETYNLDSSQGMIKLVRGILMGTLGFEIVGALLYSIRFIPMYGVAKGIWYSVFHSVSAFCNAGIDVINMDSFIPFQNDVLINFTTMMLIMCGGIGFIVWWEVVKLYKKVRYEGLPIRKIPERMTLHSKIVIITTFILVAGGTLLILALEFNNKDTIGNMGLGQKVMSSLFQSVTLRTAGFCTIDQSGFRGATFIIMSIMMFIGGSPAGTAGGVKTTTIALIFVEVTSVIRGKGEAEVLKRRINRNNIRTAISVVVITLSVLTVAIMILSFTEDTSLRKITYEAFSAMGTVGLTMNFTPLLTEVGRVVIIILMFFGRVGPITIAMAFAKKRRTETHIKDLPEKSILIG